MEWLSYVLKVSACTVFFFAFYLLFLRKLTFFSFNRLYLLISLSISFVIPSLQFTIEREVEQVMSVNDNATAIDVNLENLPEVPLAETVPTVLPRLENTFDMYALLPYLYAVIVVSFLLVTAWRLLQLLKYIRLGKKEINGLKIVAKHVGFTNCSFFNYVFIDEDQVSEAELQVLLKHEMVHAKKYHSIDKLILIVFKAVLWFNPVIYLYDKALEDVHEFEADEITSETYGTGIYANLLLKLAVAKCGSPLVHNFVKSPIKERIKMLFNTKSKDMKKLMYLLALPVALCLLWSFTVDVVTVLPKSNVTVKQDVRQLTDTLMGKSVKGKILGFEKLKLEYIMNLQVGSQILPVSCRTFKEKVKIGDEITVLLSGKSSGVINMTDRYGKKSTITEKPTYMASKVNAANGYLIYEQKITNHAFLYEVNKARFAWSKIKSFEKNNDGTINKIVLYDNGFTINLNVAAQKFKTEDFKVGDSVIAKFFGEKLIAKNTYSTDKMIVLYSWPKKYELKNEVLFDRFYEKNGKQKIASKIAAPIITPNQKSSIKPRLLSSTIANIDTKNQINYVENGVMEIYGGILEAEHLVWDLSNQTITAKVAVFKHDGSTIRSSQIVFDLKRGTYLANQALGNVIPKKNETTAFDIGKLKYSAQDSTIRTNTGLILYGKSSIVLGKGILLADEIEINTISNLVTANNATLQLEGETVKADQFQYNLLTQKGKIIGAGRTNE